MGLMRDTLKNRGGGLLISALLGFGLATVFRRACAGDHCVIIKGPAIDRVTGHVWKNGMDCFKYRPYTVDC